MVSRGSILDTVATYSGIDPSINGVYFHSIADVVGVTTANNYYSLFNPSSSTTNLTVQGVTIDAFNTGTVTSQPSMYVYRISSAPTGGTQITAPNINRFFTGFPDPQGQVFVSNPTVTTTGNALIAFAPPLGSGAGNAEGASPTPGASFLLLPGQGVVWQQPAGGNANTRWNIQMIWSEN